MHGSLYFRQNDIRTYFSFLDIRFVKNLRFYLGGRKTDLRRFMSNISLLRGRCCVADFFGIGCLKVALTILKVWVILRLSLLPSVVILFTLGITQVNLVLLSLIAKFVYPSYILRISFVYPS